MTVQTEMIDIKACRLSLRRIGQGNPLLWLHGTDGLSEWPGIIDRLAGTHAVIVPEHPGFGASEAPAWMDDVSDLAYLYLDLLKRLDLTGVDIVGHSLGGWIALEMAVRSTSRLRSLTLIAPAGIHVKGVSKTDIFMIDPDEQAMLAYADSALGAAAAERARAAKYQEEAVANRVASARFGWNPRFHNPRLERWLSRVDIPTLIVWGDADRIFPPAHAEAFQSAIPASKLAVIGNAGHLPHVERQTETLSAMHAFLGDQRGGV
ncbi:MAG: alpha/beta fold hydrolase [Hyphomicrobiaceae bacterium]